MLALPAPLSLQPQPTPPAITTPTTPTAATTPITPTLDEIARAIKRNRERANDVRIMFSRSARGYFQFVGGKLIDTAELGRFTKHGARWAVESVPATGPPTGPAANMLLSSWFDGEHTITMSHEVVLSSGAIAPRQFQLSRGYHAESMRTDMLHNPLTAMWSEYERPLDELFLDPRWLGHTIEPIETGATVVYRVRFTPPAGEILRPIIDLDPRHAFLPVRFKYEKLQPDGSWKNSHVRSFTDWVMLTSGAWMPRSIELRDPDNPSDPTFDRLTITEIDESADDAAFRDIVRGPAYVSDTWTNTTRLIDRSGATRTLAAPVAPANVPPLAPASIVVALLGAGSMTTGALCGRARRR